MPRLVVVGVPVVVDVVDHRLAERPGQARQARQARLVRLVRLVQHRRLHLRPRTRTQAVALGRRAVAALVAALVAVRAQLQAVTS
jgi:hypothetical protein